MESGTWSISWGNVIVTAIFALAVAFGVHMLTSSKPELIYQQFPPARFVSDATEVSIYNVSLENEGRKEALDVRLHMSLPAGTAIQEVQVEPTATSIEYQVLGTSADSTRQIRFPLLNPSEGARVSLLVNRGGNVALSVEVRGTGSIGRAREEKDDGLISVLPALFGLVAGVLGIVVSFFVHRATRFQEFLKRTSSEQLRAIRTQSANTALGKDFTQDLEVVLTRSVWRFVSNPTEGRAKIMRFAKDGSVVEGQNRFEHRWRIQRDKLEFLSVEGAVHNRFYFSPTDDRFYSTNDTDVVAVSKHKVLDQFLEITGTFKVAA